VLMVLTSTGFVFVLPALGIGGLARRNDPGLDAGRPGGAVGVKYRQQPTFAGHASVNQRSSKSLCASSYTVKASASSRTLAACANETRCLARFDCAFSDPM
jgi:hypothetical protein